MKLRIPIQSGGLVVVASWFVTGHLFAAAPRIDFARQVLPILSDKCFACHGPASNKKNDLRLDTVERATADLGGYRAIDPRNPKQSEVLKRIDSHDDPMPPTDAEKQLSKAERETLRQWVLQGGRYAGHWAFSPPTRERGRTLDWFIARKLKEKRIDFAPQADAATLARRASLALTGLPLEPDRLREFLNDRREDAFTRLVEELLASPRFGEHQARYWLDAVRYGDTHGLHLDNRRGIYPYRDWVVRAFNENLPLNDFITWQIAGDLLPHPTLDQQIASGYVRLNPSTGEGGAISEEFQAKNNFDRVETLGTVMLGLSLTCARCHTHKYDPIPQTEYYRLMAFFNSTAEPALDGNAYQYGPVARVPADPQAWQEWERLKQNRAELLAAFKPDSTATFISHARSTLDWKADEWRLSKKVGLDSDAPPKDGERDVKGFPGRIGEQLPKAHEVLWLSFKLHAPTHQTLWMTFASGPGFRVELDGKAAICNGCSAALDLSAGDHAVRLKLTGSADRIPLEVQLFNPWESLAKHGDWMKCDEPARLGMLADPHGPAKGGDAHAAAWSVMRDLTGLETEFTTTLIAGDLATRRETRLLARGEYDRPTGDALEPGVLSAVGVSGSGGFSSRVDLARWLTSRDQPLVSRVLINQVWQRVFGEGLVRTPEEFGRQGQQPTHPELLDWLAVELQESGWDLKHMLRLMLNSRTFRQSSRWRTDIDDAQNLLLARGPGYRLDAEVIRDMGLWASGLLEPYMGGEGVKPVQPEGLWKALTHPASNTVNYEPDTDARVYRRSLYLYWKRTSPHPMMTLFDAPSRETSCVRRSRSNTPVQSLSLFNETQRLEMARMLAERLLREPTDEPARMNLLFALLAGRSPNTLERNACTTLLKTSRERYQSAPGDAQALLSAGQAAFDKRLDAVETAAWAQVASTVMASDASILLH